MQSKFEQLKNKVIELSELDDNWDGYGALKPFSEVIENVETITHILNNDFIDRVDDIYPNPHGTITIEWINERHEKLSLEIGKTKYSYFVLYNDKDPKKVDKRDIQKAGFKEVISDLDALYRDEIPSLVL